MGEHQQRYQQQPNLRDTCLGTPQAGAAVAAVGIDVAARTHHWQQQMQQQVHGVQLAAWSAGAAVAVVAHTAADGATVGLLLVSADGLDGRADAAAILMLLSLVPDEQIAPVGQLVPAAHTAGAAERM